MPYPVPSRRKRLFPEISVSPDKPNIIEYLLLLNIEFKEALPLDIITQALGGKREHIQNIVQENSITWEDNYLKFIAMDELFGRSAEKIAEYIMSKLEKG